MRSRCFAASARPKPEATLTHSGRERRERRGREPRRRHRRSARATASAVRARRRRSCRACPSRTCASGSDRREITAAGSSNLRPARIRLSARCSTRLSPMKITSVPGCCSETRRSRARSPSPEVPGEDRHLRGHARARSAGSRRAPGTAVSVETPGHDLELDPGCCERFDLFGAAAEDERVAALQANDRAARAGRDARAARSPPPASGRRARIRAAPVA